MRTTIPLVATFLLLVLAPAGRAQTFTQDHLDAAAEMLEASGVQRTLEVGIDSTIAKQVRQNPALVPYEDVMRTFLGKYMGWSRMRDTFIQLYAETFTEDELRAITAFYRTDAGQKLARESPALAGIGMTIGEEAVVAHMDELQAMLTKRARELGVDL